MECGISDQCSWPSWVREKAQITFINVLQTHPVPASHHSRGLSLPHPARKELKVAKKGWDRIWGRPGQTFREDFPCRYPHQPGAVLLGRAHCHQATRCRARIAVLTAPQSHRLRRWLFPWLEYGKGEVPVAGTGGGGGEEHWIYDPQWVQLLTPANWETSPSQSVQLPALPSHQLKEDQIIIHVPLIHYAVKNSKCDLLKRSHMRSGQGHPGMYDVFM